MRSIEDIFCAPDTPILEVLRCLEQIASILTRESALSYCFLDSEWGEGPHKPVKTDSVLTEFALDQTSTQIVLIVDTSQRLVGSVTDGDVRRAILKGADVQQPVAQIMNPAPITARASSSELDLLRIMRQYGVGQVPLVNDAGHVVALRTHDHPGSTHGEQRPRRPYRR